MDHVVFPFKVYRESEFGYLASCLSTIYLTNKSKWKLKGRLTTPTIRNERLLIIENT
jgi:hypothetical protein